ncbi:hypothetical protein BDB01DRAFT_773784 [Pilobolus umbonatus]|nr:hypothetical protein BDB01DRAFT_773784 [Pilobolus umbonatus]
MVHCSKNSSLAILKNMWNHLSSPCRLFKQDKETYKYNNHLQRSNGVLSEITYFYYYLYSHNKY